MSRFRQSAKTGSSFEEEVEATLRCYASDGLLRAKKVEPPCRVFHTPRGRQVVFLENPFLDFVGAWTERAGRAVFFEAKATAGGKLSVGGDGGLSGSQVSALRQWTAAGAAAFVLWRHGAGTELLTLGHIAALDFKHVKAGAGFPIRQGLGFRTVDFLPVLRAWADDTEAGKRLAKAGYFEPEKK